MRRSSVAAASLTLLLALSARAEFPYAADPNRCDTSSMPAGCIPLANEMSGAAGSCSGEKWKYASTNFCTTDPTVSMSANELHGVSGMSIDIAWRLETGRPDVVIAVHDSGIMWNDVGAMSQLRKKFHLNAGELPAPNPVGGCHAPMGGDPRDCNGDGVFNMPDYDGDPAVTDVNGNGITDPEDLILLFSNGVDDDGNGYVDLDGVRLHDLRRRADPLPEHGRSGARQVLARPRRVRPLHAPAPRARPAGALRAARTPAHHARRDDRPGRPALELCQLGHRAQLPPVTKEMP